MNFEKLLNAVIDNIYNDQVGCDENAYLDGEPYHAWTESEIIDVIVHDILHSRTPLDLEGSLYCVEPKHIRFIGEERIRELVENRVKTRHQDEGAWEWEKR